MYVTFYLTVGILVGYIMALTLPGPGSSREVAAVVAILAFSATLDKIIGVINLTVVDEICLYTLGIALGYVLLSNDDTDDGAEETRPMKRFETFFWDEGV